MTLFNPWSWLCIVQFSDLLVGTKLGWERSSEFIAMFIRPVLPKGKVELDMNRGSRWFIIMRDCGVTCWWKKSPHKSPAILLLNNAKDSHLFTLISCSRWYRLQNKFIYHMQMCEVGGNNTFLMVIMQTRFLKTFGCSLKDLLHSVSTEIAKSVLALVHGHEIKNRTHVFDTRPNWSWLMLPNSRLEPKPRQH